MDKGRVFQWLNIWLTIYVYFGVFGFRVFQSVEYLYGFN